MNTSRIPSTGAPVEPGAPTSTALPSMSTVAWRRTRFEVLTFFRNREAVLFTFLFPVMLLLLFGSIFSGDVNGTDIRYTQVLCSGILASSVASVTFVSLAMGIATERDEGALKRLAGTPMPKVSYFLGKIGLVFTTAIAEVVLVLVISVLMFGLKLPHDVSKWAEFAWTFVLGVSACTLLGIAMSSVPKTAKSAAPVVNLPFVALQFISGVFVPFWQLSPTLRKVADIFPLKWMAQGFRSVFLPDHFLQVEPGGSWQAGTRALVLLVWCVLGTLLCIRTFRWTANND
jgi:ABC-2 type transport system permease protein